MKYKPTSRKELKDLVTDESIYLGDIDTSLITDMSGLFEFFNRDNYEGIENWDTSNVEYMSGMFTANRNFNKDISKWNVSKVKNMANMFFSAEKFNQPLNDWDVSKVKNMDNMFHNANSFNQDINDWNVSNVESMNHMFSSAHKFNQPLNNWDTKKVKRMSGMFSLAYAFNQDINNWNVSNVTNMRCMFMFARNFNHPLNNWDTKKVKDMAGMFSSAYAFNQNLDDWNIDNLSDMTNFNKDSALELTIKFKTYLYAFTLDKKEKNNLNDFIKNNAEEVYKTIENNKNKKINLLKRYLINNFYNELKELIPNYIESFNNIEEVYDYIDKNYNKKDDKKVKFIDDIKIENIDKRIIKYIYLSYLELKREAYRIKQIDYIINLIDEKSFINTIKTIYESTNKETSLIMYAIYGGDEALREIYKKEKDSKLCLLVFSINKNSKYAVNMLYNVFRRSKKYEIKEMTEIIIEEMAKENNLSVYELGLKAVENFGFDRNAEKIINNNQYKIILKNNYTIELFDIKENKTLKQIPKNFDDSTKEEIKYIKKEIPNIIKNQSNNLIKILLAGKKYDFNFFKEIFIDNPIMNIFAINLVWNLFDENNNFITTFRYSGDGSYTNCDDDTVNINDNYFVSLSSPIEMEESIILKWKKQLEDYELSQPIMQFRNIKINNLEEALKKLQNIEISVGSIKAFSQKYDMNTEYKSYYEINGYSYKDLYNNQKFYIKTKTLNTDTNNNYKIRINIKFNNASNRFIYTWLILLICDFGLTEIY
ncbi:BspA family leucine-rich repeat surface protein [Brachyspira intermedia]|uniref:BspA family leucine-rich repeat surface protein n=1 Tax=Brachyspira intermedia TaxID=84377 RepID=UPI00300618FE